MSLNAAFQSVRGSWPRNSRSGAHGIREMCRACGGTRREQRINPRMSNGMGSGDCDPCRSHVTRVEVLPGQPWLRIGNSYTVALPSKYLVRILNNLFALLASCLGKPIARKSNAGLYSHCFSPCNARSKALIGIKLFNRHARCLRIKAVSTLIRKGG